MHLSGRGGGHRLGVRSVQRGNSECSRIDAAVLRLGVQTGLVLHLLLLLLLLSLLLLLRLELMLVSAEVGVVKRVHHALVPLLVVVGSIGSGANSDAYADRRLSLRLGPSEGGRERVGRAGIAIRCPGGCGVHGWEIDSGEVFVHCASALLHGSGNAVECADHL